jgi:FkbM family methyltransferase
MGGPPRVLGALRRRFRRFLLRRFALPLVNRELRDNGAGLFRYDDQHDRLVTRESLGVSDLDRPRDRLRNADLWHDRLLRRHLAPEVVFDVGGGWGTTSVWFADLATRVFVFEPHPLNRERILRHHRIRRVRNVEVVAVPVADTTGETTLFEKSYGGHHSLGDIGASPTVGRLVVPVTTLDHFAAARGVERVGLLKVDVEGFEPEVLRGARGLLERRAIDLVLFEYSPAFYRERGVDPSSPLVLLEAAGYRVTDLDGRPADRALLPGGPQTDLFAASSG